MDEEWSSRRRSEASGVIEYGAQGQRSFHSKGDSISEGSRDVDADGKKQAAVTAVYYGILAFAPVPSGLWHQKGQPVADTSATGRILPLQDHTPR
ncbi:hypothetical protein JMJ35_007238 [Cladonia borealis]|uniref:Uncharacterized protein n=1 Tax=Cladonia borealis TaxID=184061 RepID=A0AA39QX12_9LECA|nr:hypothetical protein JMJ35_007238 [Cladonia borealis]